MQLEFPYQIVMFLDKEPNLNEPVYYGTHGWYPQVALKRRFKLLGVSEEVVIDDLKKFFTADVSHIITTGDLMQPERMPVRVIHITNQDEIQDLHSRLLQTLEGKIESRYPNREGVNYYPHVTAEYDNKFVINVDNYMNKTFTLNNAWLLKDVDNENSHAYTKLF